MVTAFENQVYECLKKVPCGQVTTYGELASAVGRQGASRAVGNAMNKNPFAPKVPCHRVIKNNGNIGGFAHGVRKKIALLEKEGVKIKQEKVSNFHSILYRF